MIKYYIIQKCSSLKIYFFMFLTNFIFLVTHLKILPAAYLNTLKALTSLWSQRKRGPPLLVFENRKKCPDVGVHLWIKFPTQNVVLRLSRRKNFRMFPCGVLFSSVFGEMFIKVPYFQSSLPWKMLATHLHSDIILFAKRSISNVWQCPEHASVMITAQ